MTLARAAFVTLLLGVALLAPSGAVSPAAAAATFTVTRDDDPPPNGCAPDDCSLREAVIAANDAAGADAITLPLGLYTLAIDVTIDEDAAATGDLDITDDLTISGVYRTGTIIQACDGSAGLCSGLDRLFEISAGVTAGLSEMTLQNGLSMTEDGGAVENHGALTLTAVAVRTSSAVNGGGIWNHAAGTLTLNASQVGNNKATQSPFSTGGGIQNEGTLTLTNSTVSENTSNSEGGGIFNSGAGVVTLTNSVVGGNISNSGASGAIHNDGTLSISNSTVANNTAGCEGGAIRSNDTLTITGSTFSGNTAGCEAGAILNDGTANITNSTISGNAAAEEASALENVGQMTLTNVTIADNSSPAGGGFVNNSDSATLTNVIIAGNTPADCAHFSPIPVSSHNLDSDATCGFNALSDHQGADPMLGPLANNGGPTMTHALLPGSEAIDVGDEVDCPLTDQRGRPRPPDGDNQGGPGCDIGAFEVQPGDVLWGDLLCDGRVDSTDALGSLLFVAHLGGLPKTGQCPDIGVTIEVVGASPHVWGDVDCREGVGAVDALAILRFVAKLPPLDQNDPCPDVGMMVTRAGK